VPSDATLRAVAAMFQAAGERERLGLLIELSRGAKTVAELATAVRREPSLVSQQLRVLRLSRLVRGTRDGRFIRYELIDVHAYEILRTTLEHADSDRCS
jgi:DNA-binding transcriptional ArsR family regulator